MAIKIQNLNKDVTFFESTNVLESGENYPRVFFLINQFDIQAKPIWITNRGVQREGNFQHYSGSDDKEGSCVIAFGGSTRQANLETLHNIKEPVYIDADDIDTNLSGNYIIIPGRPEKNEISELYKVSLTLKAYNN